MWLFAYQPDIGLTPLPQANLDDGTMYGNDLLMMLISGVVFEGAGSPASLWPDVFHKMPTSLIALAASAVCAIFACGVVLC